MGKIEIMEASKITVAELGNKRMEITIEDVNQAVTDLGQWFENKNKSYFEANMKNGGASDADIKAVGAPEQLAAVLKKFNGGMHFMDTFKGLSVAEIKDAQSLVGAGNLPFAKDIDGNIQVLQDGSQVGIWDMEDKEMAE